MCRHHSVLSASHWTVAPLHPRRSVLLSLCPILQFLIFPLSVHCGKTANLELFALCFPGNNALGGTSSAAMAIYAVNSWADVRFNTNSKSSSFVGTMYCTADFSASCSIDSALNEWQCGDTPSECGDDLVVTTTTSRSPSNTPSHRPTPSPTVPAMVSISTPTVHPTEWRKAAPTTLRPTGMRYDCIRNDYISGPL